MANTIQMRRGTAAEATSNNVVLAAGEWGYETDTGKVKIGDGVTAWNDLEYFAGDASSGTGVLEYQTPITAASTTFNGTQKGLNKVYPFNSASAQTITINADDYAANDVINIERRGGGTVEIVQGTGVRFRGVRDVNNRFFVNDKDTVVAFLCRGSNEFTAIGNLKRGYTGVVTTVSYTTLREGDIAVDVTVIGTGFSENMVITSSANATLNSWGFVSNEEITLNLTAVGLTNDTVTITYDNGDIFIDADAITILSSVFSYADFAFWLKLDETAGTTAAEENGLYNGTITSTTINQTGKVVKSYLFDSTSKVDLTGGGIGVTSYPFTIEFWYKASANNIINYVMTCNDSNYKGINIRIINQTVDILLGDGLGKGVSNRKNFASGNIVTANEWQKFTIKVTDFNTISLKRNGVSTAINYTTGTGASMEFSVGYTLGRDVTNNLNSIGFELDEIKGWSRLTTNVEDDEIYIKENAGNSMI